MPHSRAEAGVCAHWNAAPSGVAASSPTPKPIISAWVTNTPLQYDESPCTLS